MKTLSARKRLVVLSIAAVWAAVGFACTVEEENPAPNRARADSGGDGTLNPNGADGTAPIGDPVCGKYGGPAGAAAIANAIVARAGNDCRIGTPITANANDRKHFEECFQIMIQGAFQCPGISYVAGTTKDSKGEVCRSMQQAHQNLNLRPADYNAFLEAVAAEFTAAGMTKEDQVNIAPVFEGQKNSIIRIQNNQPDRNTHCACLNGQYNGQPCTVDAGVIVDAKADSPTDSGSDSADAGDGG
jgi:hypothetical protein